MSESHTMNGGDGTFSYLKNSSFQREATNVAKKALEEVIAEKFDIESFSHTFCIADLGCSVGPNTFFVVQNIIDAVKNKYRSCGLASQTPEFQVFFNDHAANDFNTLFASLSPSRQYFATGVPGSFYTRLFPDSSLHFVHSSFALHWLSKVPEELEDKSSPAWNKGRIHYADASDEVVDAYARQNAKDIRVFLGARARELVVGGFMVLIVPGCPDGVPLSRVSIGVLFDTLGSTLMDMAKEGIISEEKVNSFNLPIYSFSPKELTKLVEENGGFSIERIELMNSGSSSSTDKNTLTMHLRAGMEGIISQHFGSEIIDELFDRFLKKCDELFVKLRSCSKKSQLFVVLKRI